MFKLTSKFTEAKRATLWWIFAALIIRLILINTSINFEGFIIIPSCVQTISSNANGNTNLVLDKSVIKECPSKMKLYLLSFIWGRIPSAIDANALLYPNTRSLIYNRNSLKKTAVL